VKSKISVRRPSLAHSSLSRDTEERVPLGDILRKAQRDLLLRRIAYGLLLLLVVALIVLAIVNGYAEQLIDKFYALLG